MRTRAVVPALVAAVVLALVAGLVFVLAARDSSAAGRHVVVGVRPRDGGAGRRPPRRAADRRRAAGPRAAAEHRDGADGRLLPRPGRHDALRRGDARAGRRLRQRVRRRLAVLRLALQPAHRPVPPPDRRADQHRQHPEPGRPGRRLGGVLGLRQRGPELPGAVAGARLHDRLRRQVPQPVRDPRRRRPARPAGLGRLAGAVRCGLPGLGIPEHPARRRAAPGRLPPAAAVVGERRREGRRVRRHGHRRDGPRLHPHPPRRRGAVLPRGRAVRPAQPDLARRRPTRATRCSRRRSATGPATAAGTATAGWSAATGSASTGCPGTATTSPTTPRAVPTGPSRRSGDRT